MKNFYNSALSALKRRLMPNVSNNLEEQTTEDLLIEHFNRSHMRFSYRGLMANDYRVNHFDNLNPPDSPELTERFLIDLQEWKKNTSSNYKTIIERGIKIQNELLDDANSSINTIDLDYNSNKVSKAELIVILNHVLCTDNRDYIDIDFITKRIKSIYLIGIDNIDPDYKYRWMNQSGTSEL